MDYKIRVEWCHRDNQSEWCKEMTSGGLGFNFGPPGCYIPEISTICLSGASIFNSWILHMDKDKIIDAIIDVICHEEDHRIIHKVTKSARASKHFDLLFTALFNYEENEECFRVAKFDWYGMMLDNDYRNDRYEKYENVEGKLPLWAYELSD